MREYHRPSYSQYARGGFLFGVAVFFLGHVFGPALFGSIPPWKLTSFAVMEFAGIAIALCSPIVFAVVLPLIE